MRKTLDKKGARLRLADRARGCLGAPYVYGARPAEAPKRFDCSSLVQYLYKGIGVALPRVSIDQAREGRTVRPPYRDRLMVGDLIFIKGRVGRYDRRFPQGVGHVYIVTGPDEIIHAKYKKVRGRDAGSVIRQRLSTILRRRDITAVKRIL
jgi:cell wall-associated NlpC family hydrolase